jgi:YD repeat-containing protein
MPVASCPASSQPRTRLVTTGQGDCLPSSYFADGTRRSVEDRLGHTEHERADNGRDIARTLRPGLPALEHGFDAAGRRITTTVDDPVPAETFHAWDALGRLASAGDDALATTGAHYTWDAAGRLARVTYRLASTDRVEGEHAYDPLTGALTSVTWRTLGAAPQELLRLEYELDDHDDDDATPAGESAGRRTGVNEYRAGVLAREVDYRFDALHRLARETAHSAGSTRVTSFEHDAVGNRLRQTVTVDGSVVLDELSTVDANDRLVAVERLVGGEDLTLSWDPNGTLAEKSSGATYTWDVRDRLLTASAASPGGTWDFRYLIA